jgi:2-polyprenyl-6-methoxyphenol hydroxylase-like FAD-dependent oxidoreductase
MSEVLVVGAGPTGLVLALWLARLGVRVRIVDKAPQPGTTSRALAVHARTLELYEQLGLAETVVAHGHKVPAVNLWVKGRTEARVSFQDIGEGLTAYPFLHIYPQDEHEKLLIGRLEAAGVRVERSVECLGYEEQDGRVAARLRHGDDREELCEAAYIAGCDGAHSVVREGMGTGFPGGTYPQVFYVADVEASGPPMNGELHVDLDEADFLAVFPLATKGRARLIGTVRGERAEHAETMTFADVSDHAIKHLKVQVDKVNWFSSYRVHHRVTGHFRKGRAFLAGDAAHIHSPVGGQGMNTGIGDAINLAWKLRAVLRGQAPDALLDSYEPERIAFARRLVNTTDQAFKFVSSDGRLADVVRTRVAPMVIPALTRFEAFRGFMFRTVSQIAINYRGGWLAAGHAGDVHGGDRLPWVPPGGNYAPLRNAAWQVHVYGAAPPALHAWCEAHRLPLHVFPWHEAHERAGLARDALYLIRPDDYVGLAETVASAAALQAYFSERGMALPLCL